MTDEIITIELTAKEAWSRHAAHLQDVLAQRNKQIERLTERLEAGEGSEFVEQRYREGLRDGRRQAIQEIIGSITPAIRSLESVRSESLRIR